MEKPLVIWDTVQFHQFWWRSHLGPVLLLLVVLMVLLLMIMLFVILLWQHILLVMVAENGGFSQPS